MDLTQLRRTVALIASASLLASLTVATVAAPTSAARPKCDGKVATIVSRQRVIRGTDRADVIVAKGTRANVIYGKGGRDRICSGAGDDTIYGGGGNDRLFGGSGDDELFGQAGKDDIFGFAGTDIIDGGGGGDFLSGGKGDDRIEGAAGNDVVRGGDGPDSIGGSGGDDKLYGEGGNDEINGGPGTDICRQGPGTGLLTECETGEADLAVDVTCPASSGPGITTCQVEVSNNGPDASAYTLILDEATVDVSPNCSPSGWDEPIAFASLAAGASRAGSYDISCEGLRGSNRFEATVVADANDPVAGNDRDEAIIQFG